MASVPAAGIRSMMGRDDSRSPHLTSLEVQGVLEQLAAEECLPDTLGSRELNFLLAL